MQSWSKFERPVVRSKHTWSVQFLIGSTVWRPQISVPIRSPFPPYPMLVLERPTGQTVPVMKCRSNNFGHDCSSLEAGNALSHPWRQNVYTVVAIVINSLVDFFKRALQGSTGVTTAGYLTHVKVNNRPAFLKTIWTTQLVCSADKRLQGLTCPACTVWTPRCCPACHQCCQSWNNPAWCRQPGNPRLV